VKVVDVKTFVTSFGESNYVFVKVITDEGIHGVGECTLESKEKTVLGAIEECNRTLIGANPLEIEKIWQTWNRSFPWKGSAVFSAMSGLEHALWDIKGKAYGVPVYQLLGGPVRDKIRAYTWPGPYSTPEELAEASISAVKEHGFTALKIDPFSDFLRVGYADLRRLEKCMIAIRDAVGPEIEVAVDGHWRFLAPAAVQIAKTLEPFNPMFLEEPTTSDNAEGLARVRAASSITLATGERHYTRWAFWNLLRERLVDVVQPDLCHCGGIWEARKIAAMAEACDVMVAPHNPNGPVGTAAVVHIAACTPNFLITEYVHTRVGFANTLVQEPLKMVNGYIELPTAPGLGIELNEEAILATPADYKELWSPSRLVI
jgi:galactonate dehydratase